MRIHLRTTALTASLLLFVLALAAAPARAGNRGADKTAAALAFAERGPQAGQTATCRGPLGRHRVASQGHGRIIRGRHYGRHYGRHHTRHYAGRRGRHYTRHCGRQQGRRCIIRGRHYAGRHGRHFGRHFGRHHARRIVDAPYYYITTPSHRQINAYYCGPATCQIIDDYWHTAQPQQAYAAYGGMCPSSAGTVFSLLDNTLRHFTGKSYDYHGGISSASDLFSRIEYGLFTKHYPEAILLRIDPNAYDWSPYKLPHAGHIVCLEAFDWRPQADGNTIVRINDPYAENAEPPLGRGSAGGNTYGHHVYHRQLVWCGLSGTSARALIY
jgi:hypothetical protein